MAKNEKCVISDSKACRWMHNTCEQCYVNGIKSDDDKRKVLDDFEVMLSLLPDDIDTLQGEECQFCKHEKRPRSLYAVIDLAHSEPEHQRGMFFGYGKKIRQRIGSMLPTSISICKDCRRAYRIAESIQWIFIVGFIVIAIGLMLVPGIKNAIVQADSPLPYIMVIAGGIIGYILGKVVMAAYIKAKSQNVNFDVFDIPVCAKMKHLGWFALQDQGEVTRLLFSKKPFRSNIGDLKKEASDNKDFTQTSFLED